MKFHYSIVAAERRTSGQIDNFTVTAGYQLADPDVDKTLYAVSFAFCSPKDRFCKRDGRNYVTDRFLDGEAILMRPTQGNIHTAIDNLLREANTISTIVPKLFPDSWAKKYNAFHVMPRKHAFDFGASNWIS